MPLSISQRSTAWAAFALLQEKSVASSMRSWSYHIMCSLVSLFVSSIIFLVKPCINCVRESWSYVTLCLVFPPSTLSWGHATFLETKTSTPPPHFDFNLLSLPSTCEQLSISANLLSTAFWISRDHLRTDNDGKLSSSDDDSDTTCLTLFLLHFLLLWLLLTRH